MSTGRRVMVVGLEALDLALLGRLMAAGRLPNLARTAEEWQHATVASDGHALSGSVWASFAAGTGPGDHGQFYSRQWVPGEARYAAEGERDFGYEPFWAALRGTGKRSVVLDVPDTPAIRAPGFRSFYGWGVAHDVPDSSWPASFLKEVRQTAGRHPIGPDPVMPLDGSGKLALARTAASGIARRMELLIRTAGAGDWELMIAALPELHTAGHYLSAAEQLSARSTNEDAIAFVLGHFDRRWPRLVEAAGSDCDIYLFSPHGMIPGTGTGMFAGALLRAFEGRAEDEAGRRGDVISLIRDLLPTRLRLAIWNALPVEARHRRLGRGAPPTGALFEVLHDINASYRANLRGRERDGFLEAEEARAMLVRLGEYLAGVTGESGGAAFEQIWMAERDAPGRHSDWLPDLMGVTRAGHYSPGALLTPDGSRLAEPRSAVHNGIHTGEGYVYFRAAGGGRLVRGSVDVREFAPTLLERLGVEPLTDFDGAPFVT
ncbi:MAG TPA: alkaline phosphatase family protein [Tepidiformaceae bacterium]|nr:alkaline phosphatase family protein [Tepidiformaceae bacterium]